MKDKLLVSFSGGRTSAYMTKIILDSYKNKYEIVVVFANTGKEREETLSFVHMCDQYFEFNTVWVESVINPEYGEGTTHNIVTYETASRNGEPYEKMIKKYGLPNVKFPHCTRELKTAPIHHYIKKELGWIDYYTAIGIRADEIDRINEKKSQQKYIYPLVEMNITKKDVLSFWDKQSFNLQLKEHEGNCNKCFKKSLRKLLTIEVEERERGEVDNWWNTMESKYENFIPPTQKNRKGPIRFNRKNMSRDELVKLSFQPFEKFIDQHKYNDEEMDISNGCTESCEPF
jgi:hypothetical protein